MIKKICFLLSVIAALCLLSGCGEEQKEDAEMNLMINVQTPADGIDVPDDSDIIVDLSESDYAEVEF